jgi:transketolase
MITVGAAMAAQDMEVWIYSIAPFLYARPFEQIRNDICFHHLPVKLIGNGGGYGYGVMGPTHHAIEDYGALLTLPGMTVFVPTFDEDVDAIVGLAASDDGPIYLRMGRGSRLRDGRPPFQPWRELTTEAVRS